MAECCSVDLLGFWMTIYDNNIDIVHNSEDILVPWMLHLCVMLKWFA